MIKPKDLRIGNYLEIPNRFPKYYTQVTGLTENGRIWFVSNPKFEECAWNPEKIKPIPLTEEWLVKFGFLDKGNDDFILIINEKLIAHLQFKQGFVVKFNTWVSFTERAVKYVHQLQNLYYSLCGEELNLKKPTCTVCGSENIIEYPHTE